MKHVITTTLISFTALIGAAACSSEGSAPESDAEGGSVQLSLASVPSDTGCLRVSATGSRDLTRTFTLVPGSSPSFRLDRLPLGVVAVDAQAFAGTCAKVSAATVPSWVSEAPVPVRIESLVLAKVQLKLIRNGQAAVSVDWEDEPWASSSNAPVDLALIGDTPYGAVQIADFPQLIADINSATPPFGSIVHVGDIKNGSSLCDTSYFQFVLENFTLSAAPLIYTPGDNEWTDCHRANNGAYDPLERLESIRTLFFPTPGLSLGQNKKQLLSQSFFLGFERFVENALWFEAGTVFATLHVVGSNNSLVPWYTDDTTGTKLDDPARRTAEEAARTTANLAWLERTFATAAERGAKSVIVLSQADMWDGTTVNGFDSTVQKLAQLSLSFGKPVLLVEGDSHVFKLDNPLAAGDATHGVTTPVPNFTRMVVQGSTTTPLSEWVRLHVDPAASPPFSWTRHAR
jgi:hypothetical protein